MIACRRPIELWPRPSLRTWRPSQSQDLLTSPLPPASRFPLPRPRLFRIPCRLRRCRRRLLPRLQHRRQFPSSSPQVVPPRPRFYHRQVTRFDRRIPSHTQRRRGSQSCHHRRPFTHRRLRSASSRVTRSQGRHLCRNRRYQNRPSVPSDGQQTPTTSSRSSHRRSHARCARSANGRLGPKSLPESHFDLRNGHLRVSSKNQISLSSILNLTSPSRPRSAPCNPDLSRFPWEGSQSIYVNRRLRSPLPSPPARSRLGACSVTPSRHRKCIRRWEARLRDHIRLSSGPCSHLCKINTLQVPYPHSRHPPLSRRLLPPVRQSARLAA